MTDESNNTRATPGADPAGKAWVLEVDRLALLTGVVRNATVIATSIIRFKSSLEAVIEPLAYANNT
jgi:hypothetical protein